MIHKPQSVVHREAREARDAREARSFDKWRQTWRALPLGTVYTCTGCGLEFERLSHEECCAGHPFSACCHRYGDRALSTEGK